MRINDSKTSIRGFFIYSPEIEYEAGDFVVYGQTIYVCSPQDGKDSCSGEIPSESKHFSVYLGDKMTDAKDFFEFANDIEEKGFSKDKYVSLSHLPAILNNYMAGLTTSGIIGDYITYNKATGYFEVNIKELDSASNYSQEDGSIGNILADIMISNINHGIFRVSRELPEIMNYVAVSDSTNLKDCILKQYTYKDSDNSLVRVQELIDHEDGHIFYRSLVIPLDENGEFTLDSERLIKAVNTEFKFATIKTKSLQKKANLLFETYASRMRGFSRKLEELTKEFYFSVIPTSLTHQLTIQNTNPGLSGYVSLSDLNVIGPITVNIASLRDITSSGVKVWNSDTITFDPRLGSSQYYIDDTFYLDVNVEGYETEEDITNYSIDLVNRSGQDLPFFLESGNLLVPISLKNIVGSASGDDIPSEAFNSSSKLLLDSSSLTLSMADSSIGFIVSLKEKLADGTAGEELIKKRIYFNAAGIAGTNNRFDIHYDEEVSKNNIKPSYLTSNVGIVDNSTIIGLNELKNSLLTEGKKFIIEFTPIRTNKKFSVKTTTDISFYLPTTSEDGGELVTSKSIEYSILDDDKRGFYFKRLDNSGESLTLTIKDPYDKILRNGVVYTPDVNYSFKSYEDPIITYRELYELCGESRDSIVIEIVGSTKAGYIKLRNMSETVDLDVLVYSNAESCFTHNYKVLANSDINDLAGIYIPQSSELVIRTRLNEGNSSTAHKISINLQDDTAIIVDPEDKTDILWPGVLTTTNNLGSDTPIYEVHIDELTNRKANVITFINEDNVEGLILQQYFLSSKSAIDESAGVPSSRIPGGVIGREFELPSTSEDNTLTVPCYPSLSDSNIKTYYRIYKKIEGKPNNLPLNDIFFCIDCRIFSSTSIEYSRHEVNVNYIQLGLLTDNSEFEIYTGDVIKISNSLNYKVDFNLEDKESEVQFFLLDKFNEYYSDDIGRSILNNAVTSWYYYPALQNKLYAKISKNSTILNNGLYLAKRDGDTTRTVSWFPVSNNRSTISFPIAVNDLEITYKGVSGSKSFSFQYITNDSRKQSFKDFIVSGDGVNKYEDGENSIKVFDFNFNSILTLPNLNTSTYQFFKFDFYTISRVQGSDGEVEEIKNIHFTTYAAWLSKEWRYEYESSLINYFDIPSSEELNDELLYLEVSTVVLEKKTIQLSLKNFGVTTASKLYKLEENFSSSFGEYKSKAVSLTDLMDDIEDPVYELEVFSFPDKLSFMGIYLMAIKDSGLLLSYIDNNDERHREQLVNSSSARSLYNFGESVSDTLSQLSYINLWNVSEISKPESPIGIIGIPNTLTIENRTKYDICLGIFGEEGTFSIITAGDKNGSFEYYSADVQKSLEIRNLIFNKPEDGSDLVVNSNIALDVEFMTQSDLTTIFVEVEKTDNEEEPYVVKDLDHKGTRVDSVLTEIIDPVLYINGIVKNGAGGLIISENEVNHPKVTFEFDPSDFTIYSSMGTLTPVLTEFGYKVTTTIYEKRADRGFWFSTAPITVSGLKYTDRFSGTGSRFTPQLPYSVTELWTYPSDQAIKFDKYKFSTIFIQNNTWENQLTVIDVASSVTRSLPISVDGNYDANRPWLSWKDTVIDDLTTKFELDQSGELRINFGSIVEYYTTNETKYEIFVRKSSEAGWEKLCGSDFHINAMPVRIGGKAVLKIKFSDSSTNFDLENPGGYDYTSPDPEKNQNAVTYKDDTIILDKYFLDKNYQVSIYLGGALVINPNELREDQFTITNIASKTCYVKFSSPNGRYNYTYSIPNSKNDAIKFLKNGPFSSNLATISMSFSSSGSPVVDTLRFHSSSSTSDLNSVYYGKASMGYVINNSLESPHFYISEGSRTSSSDYLTISDTSTLGIELTSIIKFTSFKNNVVSVAYIPPGGVYSVWHNTFFGISSSAATTRIEGSFEMSLYSGYNSLTNSDNSRILSFDFIHKNGTINKLLGKFNIISNDNVVHLRTINMSAHSPSAATTTTTTTTVDPTITTTTTTTTTAEPTTTTTTTTTKPGTKMDNNEGEQSSYSLRGGQDTQNYDYGGDGEEGMYDDGDAMYSIAYSRNRGASLYGGDTTTSTEMPSSVTSTSTPNTQPPFTTELPNGDNNSSSGISTLSLQNNILSIKLKLVDGTGANLTNNNYKIVSAYYRRIII